MKGGFAEFLAGPGAELFGQVPFEGNGLLGTKLLKVTKAGVALEAIQRLRYGID